MATTRSTAKAETVNRSTAALIKMLVSAAITVAGSWLSIKSAIDTAAREQVEQMRGEVRFEMDRVAKDIRQDTEDQLDHLQAVMLQQHLEQCGRIDSIRNNVNRQLRALRPPVDSF